MVCAGVGLGEGRVGFCFGRVGWVLGWGGSGVGWVCVRVRARVRVIVNYLIEYLILSPSPFNIIFSLCNVRLSLISFL